ncbi:hypothetical protein [Luteimonas granuli]|uniref:Uncharacterized protein n=1 Tax=Luteimonas granuli TaxID=1176533 RepID=A0A518N4T8_9GAMM|nr:hypothetical protein [Luteimonas granuli]QDW66930.1 hypothetical protein FPZ22_08520 [Luteimonas granuli]
MRVLLPNPAAGHPWPALGIPPASAAGPISGRGLEESKGNSNGDGDATSRQVDVEVDAEGGSVVMQERRDERVTALASARDFRSEARER